MRLGLLWKKLIGDRRVNSHGESTPEIPLAKGQLGLALVHECPRPANGQHDCPVDIVFVHGLNGDIRGTWTHANGTFWPQDLLPGAVPGARIFSYGYDSRLFFSTSKSEYRDFALILLRDLQSLDHGSVKGRPILFVCHSLGGIVVKETINVAYERGDEDVLKRSKGIVFLGTPHRGSASADLGTTVANVVDAVWVPGFVVPRVRTKLIKDLKQNSKVLYEIGDRFRPKTSDIQITSFYETETTDIGRVIVDENSGVLGLVNETPYPMNRNHHQISRFESRDLADYQALVFAICQTITKILPARQGSKSQCSLTYSEKERIQQLSSVDVIEFESRIDVRTPHTLLWLSKDVDYANWLASTSTSLLLVTGHAGCGKTVLASYVRTKLVGGSPAKAVVCRFYCNAQDEKMHSAVELVRSLIHQVVSHSRDIQRTVATAVKSDQRLWGSLERLWTLFESIATSEQMGEIIVIIDAIDELEDSIQKQITGRILRLLQSEPASSVKFFITSQPQASAVADLRRHALCLALESKRDLISDDINAFIQASVKDFVAQKGPSERIRQRITVTLQKNAGQNFLWVALTLSYLKTRDILINEDLDDALSTIPPDLSKLYDRFLTSLASRPSLGSAHRLLSMVLFSIRPLHSDELALLLTIDESHESINQVRKDCAIRGHNAIQNALGPLIRCHGSTIELVHTSLKDHLTTGKSEVQQLEESKGHEMLAEGCIRYLLLQDFRRESLDTTPSPSSVYSPTASLPTNESHVDDDSGSLGDGSILQAMFAEPESLAVHNVAKSGRGYELYDYAVRFWATHFERSQVSDSSPLVSLAEKLYTDFSQSKWEDILRCTTDTSSEYPSAPDPLTLACFYGHVVVVQRLLQNSNVPDPHLGTAFYWSAAKGRTDCLKLVHSRLRPGCDMSLCYVAGSSPLAAAAGNGHTETVYYLLRIGLFGINERDSEGLSPLSLAAGRSQGQIVSVLLSLDPSHKLDVNLVDDGRQSALFWACNASSSRIVRDLLNDDRVKPNLLNDRLESALSWACRSGNTNIVKLFVEKPGVFLGTRDGCGNTPLIHAVKSRNWYAVKPLFGRRRTSRGSDDELNIAAKDQTGRNAISWAAEVADSRILQRLLAYAPGEATIQDNNGWLPLAWTMEPSGYPENAKLLIPYSRAHINDCTLDGSSVLCTAARWRRDEIAQLLIESSGIDVNLRDDDGRTALSFAASQGSLGLVRLLLLKGADRSIADGKGNLPLDWARKAGYLQIVDELGRM